MSTKICLAPISDKVRDVVTLGQLTLMIEALHLLGYDMDTPVTYLYDIHVGGHVWLETIDNVEQYRDAGADSAG